MTDRSLPDGLVVARTTPTWTCDSVPPALLGDHHTSVWAELVVETGTVIFREIADSGDGPPVLGEAIATPDTRIVIVPDRKHRIEPSDDARFRVVFYAEA